MYWVSSLVCSVVFRMRVHHFVGEIMRYLGCDSRDWVVAFPSSCVDDTSLFERT